MLTPDMPEPMMAMSTVGGSSGVERCVSSALGSVRQNGVVDVGCGNVLCAGMACLGAILRSTNWVGFCWRSRLVMLCCFYFSVHGTTQYRVGR